MEQDPVRYVIAAAESPPNDVMVVPSCQLSDRLLTDRAAAALLSPEEVQRPASLEVVGHLHAQAFLEVDIPFQVVGVCFALYLHVSLDWCLACFE